MRRGAILAFGAAVLAAGVLACGLEDGGTLDGIDGHDAAIAVDGSLPKDATSVDGDAPLDGSTGTDSGSLVDAEADSASPIGFKCTGPTTKTVTHCQTDCPGAPFECPSSGKCVASCGGATNCGFNLYVCNACAADGGLVVSRCESNTTVGSCFDEPGLQHCKCSSPSDCPSDNDVCISSACSACADPDASTDGLSCKGGISGKKCHDQPADGIGIGSCY